MNNIQEMNFLSELDNDRNKEYYARITVLDDDEKPIQSIEGRVQPGSSISINGSSSVRRTCNLNIIALEAENDLTDIDNLLSINKRIKIFIGLQKNINYNKDIVYYDDDGDNETPAHSIKKPHIGRKGKIYINRYNEAISIWDGHQYQKINKIYDYQSDLVWFPLGVYVIVQPSLSNSTGGCIISLSCRDKMCLLNGELGGNLPTSVIFDSYDQYIGSIYLPDGESVLPDIDTPNNHNVYYYNGKSYMWTEQYGWDEVDPSTIDFSTPVSVPQLIFDIIQTAVVNYGGELINKVIINDVPTELKQIVRYVGTAPLYFNSKTGQYIYDEDAIDPEHADEWKTFEYNSEIGYSYEKFTYPGTLTTNIGDNVCTVLDKIKNTLGNFEYFYDIDGNFVFQEIKNYLNNAYDPTKEAKGVKKYYLDNNLTANIENNSLKIIGAENYKVDFYGDQKSVYTFEENSGLVTSYSNTPDYTNLKNDYHIWGKNASGLAIHYHIAIKEIPQKDQYTGEYEPRDVVFVKNADGRYTGRIRMLNKDDFVGTYAYTSSETLRLVDEEGGTVTGQSIVINEDVTQGRLGVIEEEENIKLVEGVDLQTIIPQDWRAELYLQGLEIAAAGDRPDKYQQELLDLFDDIYEWGYYDEDEDENPDNDIWHYEGRFKTDIVKTPNELSYWLDFLEPVDKLYGMAVDDINSKIYSYQQDKIYKLYDDEIPNYIILDTDMDVDYLNKKHKECDDEGQPYANVETGVFSNLAMNSVGYSAQEVARNLLYQYTTYNETITIQCLPIYYLDVNQRITVRDKQSGISGDYIINSISIPLAPTSTMSITASKALNRI